MSQPPVVVLSSLELAWGIDLGKRRFLESLDRVDRAGARAPDSDGLVIHMNGALAEVAVARFLGAALPSSVNTFHNTPDIPPDIEVRWRGRATWDLIIRSDDRPRRRYVLVTGCSPIYVLRGWITKEEVCDEWLQNYGGHGSAWFVPQAALHQFGIRAAVGA